MLLISDRRKTFSGSVGGEKLIIIIRSVGCKNFSHLCTVFLCQAPLHLSISVMAAAAAAAVASSHDYAFELYWRQFMSPTFRRGWRSPISLSTLYLALLAGFYGQRKTWLISVQHSGMSVSMFQVRRMFAIKRESRRQIQLNLYCAICGICLASRLELVWRKMIGFGRRAKSGRRKLKNSPLSPITKPHTDKRHK